MEQFYIVTDKSRLFKDYFNYKKNRIKVNEHVEAFSSQNGIEAKEYSPGNTTFYVVPTSSDLEKFQPQLCVALENGLRAFKRNSAVGKAWIKSLQDKKIEVIHKPFVGMYFSGVYGKHSTRVFDVDETVYCSISTGINNKLECPEGMKEIKASEFYKVIEDDA